MELHLATGPWSAVLAHRGGRLSITSLQRDGADLLAPDGCPLIAPWFGRLPSHRISCLGRQAELDPADPELDHDEDGRPLHGQRSPEGAWRIERRSGRSAEASTDALSGSRFPFPHRLTAEVALGPLGLEVTTRLEAGPEGPVPAAFAWHPYLVADGSPSSWRLELPFREQLELVDLLPTGASTMRGPSSEPIAPRDDCFAAEAGDVASLVGEASRTSLSFGPGYGWAMVWSPPNAGFACVEPMAGPLLSVASDDPAVVVPAGGELVASFAIG